MAWHRQNEVSRRLAQVPAIGPVGASLLAMKVPDPRAFRTGRDFAAWIGLTPKDHSTAGKERLGVITRAGDEVLRLCLVRRCHRGDPAGQEGAGQALALALGARQAQAAEACGRGPRQQDGADRLEADGQWRAL